MATPLNGSQLDNKIHDFLARKSKQYPEMRLLDSGADVPAEDSIDRGNAVWFRGISQAD